MFSSNATPAEDFLYARRLDAIINLDDYTHIRFLQENGGIPRTICLRYNPGGEFRLGNALMGNPGEAKYGMTKEQIFQGVKDLMALGAIRALNDHGLRVPQDISVSGYDGIALGRYSTPRLTTIRQNSERLAQRGAEILLNCIENGSSAVHEVVPFELIEDESVAALPNH